MKTRQDAGLRQTVSVRRELRDLDNRFKCVNGLRHIFPDQLLMPRNFKLSNTTEQEIFIASLRPKRWGQLIEAPQAIAIYTSLRGTLTQSAPVG